VGHCIAAAGFTAQRQKIAPAALKARRYIQAVIR